MVGLPGACVSNMDPPSVCLAVLTILQVSLIMLVRPALARWLARPRAWRNVIALNGVIMTVFLWHLTALLFTIAVTAHFGITQPVAGTAAWWITRPLWLATLLVPLTALVASFGRLERPGPQRARAAVANPKRAWVAGLGVALIAIGLGGIAATNLVDLNQPGRAQVFVITLSTTQAFCALGFGGLLVRRSVRA